MNVIGDYLDLAISLPIIYIAFSSSRKVCQTKGIKRETKFSLICSSLQWISLQDQSHGSRYVFLIIYFIYQNHNVLRVGNKGYG